MAHWLKVVRYDMYSLDVTLLLISHIVVCFRICLQILAIESYHNFSNLYEDLRYFSAQRNYIEIM